MTRYGLGVFILRVVIPIMISANLIMRPSLMCAIYLGMLLYLPFLNLMDKKGLNIGIFKYIMTFVPYQTAATQLGFYLYTLSTDEIRKEENVETLRILKSIGMSPLDMSILHGICWFGPECLMIVVSLLYNGAVRMIISSEDTQHNAEEVRKEQLNHLKTSATVGKCITILLLFFSAVWRHTLFGVCYFLIFLFFMSVWALYKDLNNMLSMVLLFCMPVAMVHTIGMYVFQVEVIQYYFSDKVAQLSIFGIDKLLEPIPDYGPDFTHYEAYTKDVVKIFYPCIVYVLYYFMVNEAVRLRTFEKFLAKERKRQYYKKWKKKKTLMLEKQPAQQGNLFQTFVGESKKTILSERTRTIIRNIIALVVKYSHVGTVCAYMMWAVTFITWSSFVLMILSIILWILPKQRKATVYSCFGVIAFSYYNMTYVYLMGIGYGKLIGEITEDVSIFEYFDVHRYRTLELCIKTMFTVLFWTTVRKWMRDRIYKDHDAFLEQEAKEDKTVPQRKGLLEKVCLYFLVRYWIVLMAICLMSWAISMKALKYFRLMNIFYYLSFTLVLQFSFTWWRKILKCFLWWLLVMTLINMVIIYSYQFTVIRNIFIETFGIPKEFGLEFGARISTPQAYLNRLFCSMIFITMIVIQLKYFHEKFMSLTDENNKNIPIEVEEYKEQFGQLFQRFLDVSSFVYLLLEMHLMKAITLLLFLMCILDICAYFILILVPLSLSMIFPFRSVRLAVMYWAALLVSILTMGNLIYGLRFIDDSNYDVTCNITKYPYLNQTTNNWMTWIGFEKHDREKYNIVDFIIWETAFVYVSCLHNVVTATQRIGRKQRRLPTYTPEVIFPEVTYREADSNLKNCIKYLMNYGFYRLGYEICLTMLVIVIILRMDGYAIMYSVWLCLLLILKRSILRWTWILFVIFISLSIIWQYIMCTGLPPNWCIEYEWETRTYYWTVAQDFWFLVDNYHPPPSEKLIAESILLIMASQQLACFWTDIKNSRHKIDYDGGSNNSIIPHFEQPAFVNPVVDFTTYTTSYLDVAKRIFFNMSYWGCMWIVFLGSANRVNIFSIVYLCYVFLYLWHGINIYYKPLNHILKSWNHLIIQNVLIICLKSGLQVVGCFYMPDIPMQYCGLIKMSGIGCIRNFEHTDYFEKLDEGKTMCRASKLEMSNVAWDAVIFFILIIQRRAFRSYNFFHIINDAKAQHLLSARGALLLDELHETRTKEIRDEKSRVRNNVKIKLTKLLNKKKDIQGEYYKNNIITHKMAMRSGDYYMYEETETGMEEKDEFKHKEERKASLEVQHNLISLFGDMITSNMRTAVKRYWDPSLKKKGEQTEDEDDDDEGPYGSLVRIIYLFKFTWAATDVLIVNATEFLEKYTETYDMVRARLDKEKRLLKEQTDYDVGVRIEGWWLPRASYEGLIKKSKLLEPKEPPEEMSTTNLPDFLKLLKALWIITVARSDLLCYFFVMMNQVMLCQLITLPLSFMVYMWGMLSNPRPSKTFWIIMIGYVELVVLIKWLFQYEMMPGNNLLNIKRENNPMEAGNPFFPSKFMGLQHMNNYYLWEMFTVMAILIHRHYLMRIGLWTNLTTSAGAGTNDGYHIMDRGALVKTTPVPSVSTATRLYVIRSNRASILDNMLSTMKSIIQRYASSAQQFQQRLLLHVHQEACDHYTVMFFFDFLAFLTVATTCPHFFMFEPENTVWTYLSTSVVPVRYVMVVFSHFVAILVDRAIYLKKDVVVKLIFHNLHTVFVHIWLFIIIPHQINGRIVIERAAITAYYIFRCIYLLISAQQIRIGYPSRIWGFYCCHAFGLWNYINIRAYLLMPFLFELRSSFDWMFTDTTMSVFDWFKMEDIYTSVYKVKCLRSIEEEYGSPPGVMKKAIYKYTYGITLSLFFIFLIWFPLLVYSWGREAGQSNVPSAATLEFKIGDVEPIYENEADILTLRYTAYQHIKQVYNAYDVSKDFFYQYDHTDVAVLVFSTGGKVWMLRPQEEKIMIRIINSAHPVPIKMTCNIILKDGDEQRELKISVRKTMFPYSRNRRYLSRVMGEDKNVAGSLEVHYLLPKFLMVEQRGHVSMVDLLMYPEPNRPESDRLRNITFEAKLSPEEETRMWWEVTEDVDDENYKHFLEKMPHGSLSEDYIVIFTFNDKIVHAFFNLLTGGSIIAFYSVFLFVVHGWSRQIISGRLSMVWLFEAPQVDIIYSMCNEVYICREAKMWELEEVAASRVFFTMKSTETAIKLSRFHGNPYNPTTDKRLPSITRRS